MLISITEKCRMGCTHCMDNATPEGNNMTMETFKDTVNFFNSYGALEFIITGGEPTENPKCCDMIEYAINNVKDKIFGLAHITLATNAMNIIGNKELQDRLLELIKASNGALSIQVTYVPEYYPIKMDFSEDFFKNEAVVVCNKIESMYPLGRARDNNIPYQAKASRCFNIRSMIRSTDSIYQSTFALAIRAKFCTPRINYNGDIKLGESRLCPTVATIYDSEEVIIDKIKNFRCGQCDILNKKLPDKYLKAIGEL